MPELPEVETTRIGLSAHILGRRVKTLQIFQPALRWPVSPQMREHFEGQQILGLDRRGKYLLLTTNGGTALIHLGMSGSLRIAGIHEALRKHDHWQMELENGLAIRYHDPRRFGAFLWAGSQPQQHVLLANLGPEPLLDGFDADHLYRLSRDRSQPVKNFLMDSRVVVGVGNIYASESLFRAGIHPQRSAGRISRVRYGVLAEAVRSVLSQAIDSGGSTLRDYVNGSGKPGYFQQKLQVYGREGLPCFSCAKPIVQKRLGQRSSFYCIHCQF